MSANEWYESHDNMVSLGRWLVEDEGYTSKMLLGFIEKPWQYQAEWDTFQAMLAEVPS